MPHSLQCPRCKGTVSVADNAGGQRVQCPHCDAPFLVPGAVAARNDDDDWLKLDDEVPTLKSRASSIGEKGFGDAKDLLSAFTAEIDDTKPSPLDDLGLPPITPLPPVKSPGAASPKTASIAFPVAAAVTPQLSKPTATPPPSAPVKAKTPTPDTPQFATEFRLSCPICGSMTYAKAAQAGRQIKCHDCHSSITVPQPPRVRTKPVIDLENAETFQFETSQLSSERPPDPFLKSAEELLRNAEKDDTFQAKPDLDTPDIAEWAKNVFGIFLDIGVIAHWLILSAFGAIPAAVALSLESGILVMGLFPAGIVFGVLVLGCAFAILQSVANEEEQVSEWPVFDPAEWFGQMITAAAAVVYVAAPAYGIAFMAFGHTLPSVAIAMFGIFALFPFLLLSILDMQSIFTPFSPEVARSVTKCEEAWGGFYFSSAILFGALFLFFLGASSLSPPVQAAVGIVATIAVTFIYFAMIGRLAFAIGQVVDDRKSEPEAK